MIDRFQKFIVPILQMDAARVSILLIILVAAILRMSLYGNPTLSIATNDTDSYVEASHAALFSSEMWTGRRLLSTNLIYKALEPKEGYQILVNGSIQTHRRQFQPGFDRIVILQLFLSITGWSFLAWTVADHMKNPVMKSLATVVILLFAFTPHIADWDSILMSESAGFSLFALQLALMIRIVFKIYDEDHSNLSLWLFSWAAIFFVWMFLRDTNLFASLATALMIAVLLIQVRFRKNRQLQGMLAFIIVIFLLGLLTSSQSTRSQVQMVNIYKDDLLRSEASIATLQELGMPAPHSAEFPQWFEKNASITLVKFMLIHPGYPLFKIIKDFPAAFTEIKQYYFHAPEQEPIRSILMEIGNALHPENTMPFLMNILLLTGLVLLVRRNGNSFNCPWTWLAFWLFLLATLTLIPTILGDTWALNRHALFSTTVYRLSMWMFALIVIDLAIEPARESPKLADH